MNRKRRLTNISLRIQERRIDLVFELQPPLEGLQQWGRVRKGCRPFPDEEGVLKAWVTARRRRSWPSGSQIQDSRQAFRVG